MSDQSVKSPHSSCWHINAKITARSFCLALTLLFYIPDLVARDNDSLLQELKAEITRRPQRQIEKLERIASYKALAAKSSGEAKFIALSRIYSEYKLFQYDSAFRYATDVAALARELKDPHRVAGARLNLAFVLISSGIFHEALDTLRATAPETLPDTLKSTYFYLLARTYYNLADYYQDHYYAKRYYDQGRNLIDEPVFKSLPKNTAGFALMMGRRAFRHHDMKEAKMIYENILQSFRLTAQQYAIVTSQLSYVYLQSGEKTRAKEMLIRSALSDLRSGTRETTATMRLAQMLSEEGDVEDAYTFIKIAKEDADFYGARLRQAQVATLYPLIEGKQLSRVESNRNTWLAYSLLLTVFALSIIGLLVVIFRQNKKLKKAGAIISEANDALRDINRELGDANKIKEEYIWYYFNTTVEYIHKLDSLKKSMEMRLMTKKPEELRALVNAIDIRVEREELYYNFDKVFLKLFPDFVEVYNSLFKEEDRIVLKGDQRLTTELRIMALIRMGINDHERIAKILDYSLSTIYTYKARLRSKSIVSNEEFDRRIMNIRVI